MIIITGIGRCGTSLVTSFLQRCGLDVGSTKWFKPMNAGLENRHTVDINNRLIRYYVKGEDINLHHVRGDIEDLLFDVVKDTQFLTHPSIIQEWLKVRDDIQIIWMRRDPEKIVESVYRMSEWNTPVYRTRVDLIQQKEKEFQKVIKTTDHHVYQFPDILENPKRLIQDVMYELPDDAEDIWINLIDGKDH